FLLHKATMGSPQLPQVIPAIRSWGYTEQPLEHSGQVFLAGKAALERNLCEAHAGRFETPPRMLHPTLDQVLVRGFSCGGTELPNEVAGTQTSSIGHRGKIDGPS